MTNGEESENEDRRIRRILTKSCLVHDIDSALDLQNHGRFDVPDIEKKTIGVIKDKKSTKEIHFTNNPQNVLNVGRVSRHKIIRDPVGLKNAASKAKTEIDHFFYLLLMKCWLMFYTILIKRSIHYLLNFLLISTKISNIHL